ncbi:hypothetical protein U1120_01680 [Listeria monocytogenes]
MSKDFLLEIGLEEMPAQYVSSSVLQLEKRVTDWLTEKRSFNYDDERTPTLLPSFQPRRRIIASFCNRS